ncbi:patatin-like phospholipase family protein [Aquibacillus albus]|uniref:NTE family protein n=1 Tax=Aquibacillus albus TaxID=1168171 RepID=A0ABS2N2E3_9BACI|nr:patatin-like phospholipase family protein [Aquibacillus albus]MBM7572266.1 NTE family protein [Aquibacillus albus]
MKNPKIGLALGSGGARGFSHLGVIKVLEENGVPIDFIAGSSMGALIGTLYGAGQQVDHLYQLAKTFKRKYFLDFTVPKMGFIQGNRIKDYIQLFTYNKKLEAFHIPVGIVATNLYTGKKKVFTEGSPAEAVRASISIPGFFVPAQIGDELYIDGGVIDRVPVSVAKEMGADIVIAVDCSHFIVNTDIQSIYDVMLQSIDIMQDELVNYIGVDADVMLIPDVSNYSSRAYTNIMEIVEAGEKEAKQKLNQIFQCIEIWKEKKK